MSMTKSTKKENLKISQVASISERCIRGQEDNTLKLRTNLLLIN